MHTLTCAGILSPLEPLCSRVDANLVTLGRPRSFASCNYISGRGSKSCILVTPRPRIAVQATARPQEATTTAPLEAEHADSCVDTAIAPDAAEACLFPLQYASLTRVMYMSSMKQTRAALSTASQGGRSASRGGAPAGLSSLLILAATVATFATAAVRGRLRAVRECASCRGYGVQRCKLCSGKGTIDWEGKMAHREPCPMCLGRRLVKCTCCGGGPFIARALFNHKSNKGEAALVAQLQNLAERPRSRLPRFLRRRRTGELGDEEDDDRIEESDKLAEQIMMD
jgi:hypothetical protein